MNSDNQYMRELLEGEDYYEKQFEDYLRLNPIEEMDALAENYDEEKEQEEQTLVGDFEEEEEEQKTVECNRCMLKFSCRDCVYYNSSEQWLCEGCAYDCIQDLLAPYSEEERKEIFIYTEEHNLTIKEAIYYQTHCHCCGKHVENAIIDSESHQYCGKRCFEHCEDYWYPCFQEANCRVCHIAKYHQSRDSLTDYDIQLSEREPVLVSIDAFQELNVYKQVLDCLGDLAEYYDISKLNN